MRDKVLKVFELYAEGGSIHAARNIIGMSGRDFYASLRQFPDLAAIYKEIQRDRADMMVDESYQLANNADLHPGLMREQIKARIDIAKMYDRARFGDKLDVTLEAGPSIIAAERAAALARAVPLRNLNEPLDAEYVAIPSLSAPNTTDNQSVEKATHGVPNIFD